jgi:hypothetical protein
MASYAQTQSGSQNPLCGRNMINGHRYASKIRNSHTRHDSHGAVVVETCQEPVIMDVTAYDWFRNEYPYGTATITQNPASQYAQIKADKKYMHRIIATQFLGPPPSPEHIVDHINQIKLDNRAANLRWVTTSENNRNKVPNKPLFGRSLGGIDATTRDLPRYIHHVRETDARGDYFELDSKCHPSIKLYYRSSASRSVPQLDKYMQVLTHAKDNGLQIESDGLDAVSHLLRTDAIALFRLHAEQGGTAHSLLTAPEPSAPALPELQSFFVPKPAKITASTRTRVTLGGCDYTVIRQSDDHLIIDRRFENAFDAMGKWTITSHDAYITVKTNGKDTVRPDVVGLFPSLATWPKNKITAHDFVWRVLLRREVPDHRLVHTANMAKLDVRERNLVLGSGHTRGDRRPYNTMVAMRDAGKRLPAAYDTACTEHRDIILQSGGAYDDAAEGDLSASASASEGEAEGASEGEAEGASEGEAEGEAEGASEGASEGEAEGASEKLNDASDPSVIQPSVPQIVPHSASPSMASLIPSHNYARKPRNSYSITGDFAVVETGGEPVIMDTRVLEWFRRKHGHASITVSSNYARFSKGTTITLLHTAIAEEFSRAAGGDQQPVHIDRVKTDNRLCNLGPTDATADDLRAQAVALFRRHVELGGTAHTMLAQPQKPQTGGIAPEDAAPKAKKPRVANRDVSRFTHVGLGGDAYSVVTKNNHESTVILDRGFEEAFRSMGEWSLGLDTSITIPKSIGAVRSDIAAKFPELARWPASRITVREFVWVALLQRPIPDGIMDHVGTINQDKHDARARNLVLVQPSSKKSERCPHPEIKALAEEFQGVMPRELAVQRDPARKDEPMAMRFSVSGQLCRMAGLVDDHGKGSYSTRVPFDDKFASAIAILEDVYGRLGRNFRDEHAAYVARLRERGEILKLAEAAGSAATSAMRK